ncbi:MAG: DNA (cytosine-5-)-methyltransferase [Eggerthellaceae bacterium]|jgi:DNA (cytosine-5)-methyltransferase 1
MTRSGKEIRVAEMFAGVGGFRLALDGYGTPGDEFYCEPAGPFRTVWANQWEPEGSPAKQFAWRCYESHFGKGSCVNEDINKVLEKTEAGEVAIPDFDMLVGGFPCQDYSVARPLSQAKGIEGKKGVLWWDIYKMVHLKRPRLLLLENVDRLLKSPASQRGRDFAIILSCLADEGYSVEWRVINAAEYGMPQKRRRTYIYGELTDESWDLQERVLKTGVIARAFPVEPTASRIDTVDVTADPYNVSQEFGKGLKVSPFQNAGAMQGGEAVTMKTVARYSGDAVVLGDLVVPDSEVPEQFFIADDKLERWKYLKGPKKEPRTTKAGFTYNYSEGGMAFPDFLDRPARTILTGEGGTGPSRMKHVILGDSGRYRRLVPDELDQIQMFPKGWTRSEGDGKTMSDGHRAFCMGNALVVGIPHRIGKVIAQER